MRLLATERSALAVRSVLSRASLRVASHPALLATLCIALLLGG